MRKIQLISKKIKNLKLDNIYLINKKDLTLY